MADYTELFDQRGSSYDRAMQAFPRARAAEFRQLLEPLDLSSDMVIGDVPAGGGYLGPYLPQNCEWVRHEPCSDFTTHAGQGLPSGPQTPLYPFPWKDDRCDAVVSLAGVHHLEDKPCFYREAARVTCDGGAFVLSDVAEGHPASRFLDEFVGAYNSTGHEGRYLGDDVTSDLEAAGWRLLGDRQHSFHWVFETRGQMSAFTRLLFDICEADEAQVEQAIGDLLGIDDLPGGVGMRWGLRTIRCRLD